MKELDKLTESFQTLDELLDDKGFQEGVVNLDYYNTIGKEITEEDLKEYNNTHGGVDLFRHHPALSNYDIIGTKEWNETQRIGSKEWHSSKLARHLRAVKK